MPETVPESPDPLFLFHVVFMIMSEANNQYTEISLKKILTLMVNKYYPEIYEVAITSSCYDDICRYNVYLLVKYNDMVNLDGEEVKKKVREFSKYVLRGRDNIDIVSFADRDNNY
jgi:hypothetical protein